jgi:hypothetical protein
MVTKRQKEILIESFKSFLIEKGFRTNKYGKYEVITKLNSKIKIEFRDINLRIFKNGYKIYSKPIVNTDYDKLEKWINKIMS